MSKQNSTTEFELPFYKNEEKRFLQYFGGKVLFPSITTELDLMGGGEKDTGELAANISQRKLLGVIVTPEVVLFAGNPNDGGHPVVGNNSMGVFLQEDLDADERTLKKGAIDASHDWASFSRFDGDERIPTDSCFLVSWQIPPLVFDQIEKGLSNSAVEMKIYFDLDIWRNDDGDFAMIGEEKYGLLGAKEIAELTSINFVKKIPQVSPEPTTPSNRDWNKIVTASLLGVLLILQILIFFK